MERKYFLLILGAVVLLVATGVADFIQFKSNGGHVGTSIIGDARTVAETVARGWITQSAPTYVFDGAKVTLLESKQGSCDRCFSFVYSFESAHGGFGDRSDLLVTQVITPHTMEVEVKDRAVVKAITDGKYNELTGALAE